MLHSMWDLPGPGLERVSPALAGGFLTTAPPGKPLNIAIKWTEYCRGEATVFKMEVNKKAL